MLFIYMNMNCVKNMIYNNNTKKVFPIIPNSNSTIITPKKPNKSSSFKSFFKSKYTIHPKKIFIKQKSRLSISRNTNLSINTSIAQYHP